MKNKYKVNEEAVKKIAERVYDNGSTVINRNDLEEMFPALKESEDERIRKELIDFFLKHLDYASEEGTKEQLKSWIAWLEKQGEQKPVEWSEEDEDMRYKATAVLNKLCASNKEFVFAHSTLVKVFSWLKSLRPQKKWKPSEEMLEALYRATPALVKEKSEDEILLDKLYQGLKYGRILSNN